MARTCKSLEERFWDNVDKNPGHGPNGDCWLWTGTKTWCGYGRIVEKGRTIRAHRLSYEIHHGTSLGSLFACHRCDFPPCVNPDHIFPGTAKDNAVDRNMKGRTATGDRNGSKTHPEAMPRGDSHYRKLRPYKTIEGEKNGRAKLTLEQVIQIRLRFDSGEKRSELAKEFGVSWTAINKACNGDNWLKALTQLEG